MSDIHLDHDQLVAYVDGELPAERAAAVEKALMHDSDAWETVRLLRLSANAATRAFAPVLEEAIPQRLIAAAGIGSARALPRNRARLPPALAASLAALAIGLAGGYALRGESGGYVAASLPTEDPLKARFEAALESLLDKGSEGASVAYESGAAGQGHVVLGHAFVTGAGRPCQEFHRAETRGTNHAEADGIACRAADQSWSVMILPAGQ
jgi:anti-sigma factor RsiW